MSKPVRPASGSPPIPPPTVDAASPKSSTQGFRHGSFSVLAPGYRCVRVRNQFFVISNCRCKARWVGSPLDRSCPRCRAGPSALTNRTHQRPLCPAPPVILAETAEILARPVERDTEELSGQFSDQEHCTFHPTLSHHTRKLFPNNGSFLSRLAGNTQHYFSVRDAEPVLEPECKFHPQLHIMRKRASGGVNDVPLADRMSQYRARPQAPQVQFPFKPQLNDAKTRQIQQEKGDTRTFLERQADDTASWMAVRRAAADTAAAKAKDKNPGTAAGLAEFLSRYDQDVAARKERFQYVAGTREVGARLRSTPP